MTKTNKDFWEGYYQDNPDSVEVPDSIIENEIAGLPVKNLLDIGCGTGKNIFKLAELGWSVSGIDISERAIEIARAEAVRRKIHARLYAEDSTTWEPPCTFRLVLSAYALPGGEDSQRTLETATKALDSGGTLIVTEWDKSMGEAWEFMKDDLMSPDDIVSMIPELEIEKAEIRYFDDLFPTDDRRAVHGTWANVSFVRAVKPK